SLDEAAQRFQSLHKDASDDLRRAAYLQVRWAVRGLGFANPLLDFDRLLFVKRFTQETYPDVCLNHMPWCSRPGGDLCVLSAAKGEKLAAQLAAPGGDRNSGVVLGAGSAVGHSLSPHPNPLPRGEGTAL